MPVITVNERQYALNAVADLGIAQIGAGNEVRINLPPNALLTGLGVQTVTAFNAATTNTPNVADGTNTLTVADGTTTFVNAVDVKTVGAETVANLAAFYPSGGTLTISMAQTGIAATAGRAIAVATYQILGRVNEVQG